MVRERGERPASPVPPAPVSPERGVPPLPIDWMVLDEQEHREVLQDTLFVWVPRMVRSYGFKEQVVPPCWYKHEPMIHELLALFQYRQQQQFNKELGPPPSAPIDFQYQLSLWESRMRSLTSDSGCSSSDHFDQHVPEWADPAKTQSASWAVEADEYVEKEENLS